MGDTCVSATAMFESRWNWRKFTAPFPKIRDETACRPSQLSALDANASLTSCNRRSNRQRRANDAISAAQKQLTRREP